MDSPETKPAIPVPGIDPAMPEKSSVLYGRLLGYVKPLRVYFLLGVFGFVVYSASSTLFFDLLRLSRNLELQLVISSTTNSG